MKKARNHVTYIQQADGKAQASEETEQKAQAETKKGDPKNAEGVITANTEGTGEIDGNGSGIKFTTKAAKEHEKEQAKATREENKQQQKVTKEGLKNERLKVQTEFPNENTQLDEDEKEFQNKPTPEEEKAEEEQKANQEAAEQGLQQEDVFNPATSQEENQVKEEKKQGKGK